MEYVQAFARKYQAAFPFRTRLFILPKNEYGVRKLVCTTLRKSLLPYRDVYDMQDLATFVCRYMQFEPLENDDEYPTTTPSPTQVLAWKTGDCFDTSILLASFMLGAGYDAFVVSGYAPTWIRTGDQTSTAISQPRTNCSKSVEQAEEKPRTDCSESVDEPEGIVSFNRLKATAATSFTTVEEHTHDKPSTDLKIHAWVLVRGTHRELHRSVFIEPSSGRIFPVDSAPYGGVETIWNTNNYWINMQDPGVKSCQLNYDFVNTRLWEPVFVEGASQLNRGQNAYDVMVPAAPKSVLSTGLRRQAVDVDENQGASLDIPPSWVSKLTLEVSDFSLRYPPDGQRTIFYCRSKLELFSANRHTQGMITRLSLYEDDRRTLLVEIEEQFINRQDRLQRRLRSPREGKVIEDFLPGRSFSLQSLTEYAGKRREFLFYVEARQDGLVSRYENIGKKITEHFKFRADGLSYRSVSVYQENILGSTQPHYTLPCGESAGDLLVNKMTQKYKQEDPEIDGVSKRTFYVRQGRIRTLYHYRKVRVTRQARIYIKEQINLASSTTPSRIPTETRVPCNQARQLKMLPATTSLPIPNQGTVIDDCLEALQPALSAERDCLTEIRRSQLEVLELLKMRRREEMNIVVEQPIYQTSRDHSCPSREMDAVDDGLHAMDKHHVDYLTPFLTSLSIASISHDEAQRARDGCLQSLKERLIERANIIMTRLNEENARLAKRQAAHVSRVLTKPSLTCRCTEAHVCEILRVQVSA